MYKVIDQKVRVKGDIAHVSNVLQDSCGVEFEELYITIDLKKCSSEMSYFQSAICPASMMDCSACRSCIAVTLTSNERS